MTHSNSLLRALSLALALCILCSLCIGCAGKKSPAEDAPSLAERQTLSLTGVGNARELGGYKAADGKTVKRGVLLRSARLRDATEDDVQKLTEDYHLGVIVDLRGADETENAPDVLIEGVEYRNIDILGDEATIPEGLLAELDELEAQGIEQDTVSMMRLHQKYGLYSDQFLVEILSSDAGKAGYGQFFRELLALPEGEALLFHCSHGKDRTGCAAMLLLFALGADEETVMEDYLLTNEFNAALIAEERQYLAENGAAEDELDAFMATMDQVFPALLENAVAWMTEAYGSPLGYITQSLGVSADEIAALRERFLE